MSALKEILDRNYSIVIDKKCPAGYVSIEIYDPTCTQIESYLIRDFLLCEEDGLTIEDVLEDMMIRIRKKERKHAAV